MKHFVALAKPGIIFGNAISLVGGFFLASHGRFDLLLFLATLLGVSMVIGSGGTFNNCIDRDIDALMERTKSRALPMGMIKIGPALASGTFLGVLGFGILVYATNLLAVAVAAVGWVVYVVFYSLWLKRRSLFGTLVGSISGAVPPLVGYVAVTGAFDEAAWLLFLALCLWQMPHFYAIALFRFEDFRKVGIPVLPPKPSFFQAKAQMALYTLAFVWTCLLLGRLGYVGIWFVGVVGLSGLGWFSLAIMGFFSKDELRWARQMFAASILMVTMMSLMMVLDTAAAL